jgi:hypothetical protein
MAGFVLTDDPVAVGSFNQYDEGDIRRAHDQRQRSNDSQFELRKASKVRQTMQIPETPSRVTELDLMKLLAAYGAGDAMFSPDRLPLGQAARQACMELHSMLASLERTVAPLLDKVTAKEMDAFTSHDRRHALKVAHIMWHIITPERRSILTPPEIGLLIAAAFIHDLGMFLSDAEREMRLSPESDLWQKLEVSPEIRAKIEGLKKAVIEEKVPARQQRLIRRLYQAQEALLCTDNRERHATAERYTAIYHELHALHQKSPTNIVDIDAVLAFEGDSYLEKLLDICVSHGESADALVRRDPSDANRPRFPRDYPIGSTTADLQFVAAALRMADILDYDRERTPTVLFHYFIPSALNPADDRSALEWSKHLAVSNWHIEPEEIVFRCRCRNHVVHHAIVQFCDLIAQEVSGTLATFGPNGGRGDMFALPSAVKADIHAEGYAYVPYKFELDDERIYQLLMGGAIYNDPLHAIRELVQNSVDACCLRDALTRLNDPALTPNSGNRIIITYREPKTVDDFPTLEVSDTGTGMDDWVINRWFLKVGKSFYSSTEFNQFRVQLRKQDLDFAPVSEFGIGFLSAFLLADKVEVETAMWEPLRGDTRKRILEIHGPTRLIRMSVDENTGAARFRGTRVVLTLKHGAAVEASSQSSWPVVLAYLKSVCLRLPYRLQLRHISPNGEEEEFIDPTPLTLNLPSSHEANVIRIPVNDTEAGIKGEIALLHPDRGRALESDAAKEMAARVIEDERDGCGYWNSSWWRGGSCLIRAGFFVGSVPGLPDTYKIRSGARAIIFLEWANRRDRRYASTNLSRTELVDEFRICGAITRIWLSWLFEHINELPEGLMNGFDVPRGFLSTDVAWLESFDAFEVYRLAANSWHYTLMGGKISSEEIKLWEESSGKPLPRRATGRKNFHIVLQDLVLPKVCRLLMGEQGVFWLSPPAVGWREILKSWRNYATQPVSWGGFAEYVGSIESDLYNEYPGSDYLNSKYRTRVEAAFNQTEIPELIECLRALAYSKQERQVELSNHRLSLLRRAQETLGDLEISELFKKWRLDSFPLPKSRES